MSEKGDLYKTVSFRFSYLNEKHAKCLEKLADYEADSGEPKSRVIIKALVKFFEDMESDGDRRYLEDAKKDFEQYANGQKERLKNEIRQELMKELFGIVSGIGLRGRVGNVVPMNPTEPAREKEGSLELEVDAGIVESAMKWG